VVGVDRDEIGRIAHRHHPVAAPVSCRRLQQIIEVLAPPDSGRVIDLGCVSGAWLLRALETHPGLVGVGLDVSQSALADAKREADNRCLSDRARWVEADASAWSEGAFDVVICVGASHAFGGLEGTLSAVRAHLRSGGQAVVGDTIWEQRPTRAAQEALQAAPDDFPNLAGLVECAHEHQFEIGYGHVSTLEEWDDYEWSWTGSLVRWALDQTPGGDEQTQALTAAREHRDAWLKGYRQQLGFVTLVLLDQERSTP
jgi:SAM-dependent methyltransferase